jgi:hypothetical protein
MSLIQTFRKPRIYGIALFDLILAIIGTEILFRYMGATAYLGVILAVPIGVLVHYFGGFDTTLNYKLGLSKIPVTT